MNSPCGQPLHGAGGWFGYLIGPALFALAAWFLWGADPATIPAAPTPPFDREALSDAPRRAVLDSPPRITINGYERTCMDCHRVIPPRETAPARLMQHTDIVMRHGINDQCRNCHALDNRDQLVLRGGEEIPFGTDEQLCAQCHGPTYRDWERGTHGRTNGFWDASRGAPRKLRCTQCHDPHSPRTPAMDPLVPLPGPNTLRMGHPAHEYEAPPERDPLRREVER